jgi:membrane-associated phospholipid phosphatase
MDWRSYHAVNDWFARHAGLGHAFDILTTLCVVALVLGALALWFVSRPGAAQRWRFAAAAGLAAGALGYVLNQVIHAIHDRARPYEAHGGVWHPYASGADASFPSDHASAAFGIAWAVFLVDRAVGALFLAAAAVVAVGRVATGAHYPGDVLAGVLVGLAAALIVVRVARRPLERLVGAVSRLTDSLLPARRRRAA